MFRKLIIFLLVVLLSLGLIYGFYYFRWRHFWSIAQPLKSYEITEKSDDTLRVIMIGDSWAGVHHGLQMDTFLCSELKRRVSQPVKVISKGKGGAKSKGIYQLMFESDGDGTKTLFQNAPDYCIISAGINDAAANLGTKQFCAHYRMILSFLFEHKITPIIIEIPDVDLWHLYMRKSKKDLLTDYLRSTMTRCGMYRYREYCEALRAMILEEHLMEHVVYVPMADWNGEGTAINQELFMTDRVHLNRLGYERLDARVAKVIARDLQQSQNSALVNQPMHKDAE